MDLRTLIEGHSRLDPAGIQAVYVRVAPWLPSDVAVSEGAVGLQVQVRPGALRVASMPGLEQLTVEGYGDQPSNQLEVTVARLPSLQRVVIHVAHATFEEPLPVTHADLQVRDLHGLGHLRDVERLHLLAAAPGLERLSPCALRVPLDLPALRLADPSRLQRLDLRGAATTLGGIERFPELRRLDIASCAVRDLWPLLGLEHLEVLDVRDVQADLEPLTLLPSLKLVAVAGCRAVPAALDGRATAARQANLGALAARAARAAPAAAALAGLGSLLLAEDAESIGVACDELAREGDVAVSDWLLEGVSPTHLRSMHLHPGPSARAFHLLALLRLLAQAPPGSVGAPVRDAIEHVEAWFPAGSDAPVDLSVFAAFPRLQTVVLHRVTRVVALPPSLALRHLELGFAPGVEPPPGLAALAPGAVITRSPA